MVDSTALHPRARTITLPVRDGAGSADSLQLRAHRGEMAVIVQDDEGYVLGGVGIFEESDRLTIVDHFLGGQQREPVRLDDKITGSAVEFTMGEDASLTVHLLLGARGESGATPVVIDGYNVPRLMWWLHTAGEVLGQDRAANAWAGLRADARVPHI